MIEAMKMIIQWYNAYFADGFYLVAALFSYVYLFVHCPELRKRFLVPMAVVMFLVLNPILYQYVYSRIVYWRLFWMFPTGILIALAVVKLVKNSSGKLVKIVVLVAMCGLIIVKGTNIYTERGFWKTENAKKLPGVVKELCDIMLELEENPKCIMPQTLFSDVRQYSGEIRQLYGRDVVGYIMEYYGEWNTLFWQMEHENPHYELILDYAKKNDCQFVIMYAQRPFSQEVLEAYGYEKLEFEGDYCIFHIVKAH